MVILSVSRGWEDSSTLQRSHLKWASHLPRLTTFSSVNDFPNITQVVGDSERKIGEKDSDQAKSACLQCIAAVFIHTGESQSVQVHGLTVGHTGQVV